MTRAMDCGTGFSKVMNDPIHGHISLDATQLRFIDTPQFQRLRDLKQLGSAYYVFPGGSHNRYEHSIGVSYLADTLVRRLAKAQPELDITERDVECVKIAGLCHDLGHGPFSHVFDGEFIPAARPGLQWTHEQGSEMLLEYLIDDNGVDIDQRDLSFIKDLIQGASSTSTSGEKAFLFDIVANKRNSVDVDKFDYIQRDCYNVGLKSSYDCSRLMLFSRVIDNQICYSHKEVYNLYEMFHTRYSLFKRIYTHKVGKAVEYMIVDAMLAADPYMDFSGAIDDPERYTYLTDSILKDIEQSNSDELKPARDIIRRLRKRQLYKFVDAYTMPTEIRDHLKSRFTVQSLLHFQDDFHRFTENDVIIEWLSTNYGMKNENPVDKVHFFGKWSESEAFSIPREQVSYVVPERYNETTLRVFSRDPEKVPAIQKAFRACLGEHIRDVRAMSVTSSPAQRGSGVTDAESPLMIVRDYQPLPAHTVPNEMAWKRLSESRGWSPRKTPVVRTPATTGRRGLLFDATTAPSSLANEFGDLDINQIDRE